MRSYSSRLLNMGLLAEVIGRLEFSLLLQDGIDVRAGFGGKSLVCHSWFLAPECGKNLPHGRFYCGSEGMSA